MELESKRRKVQHEIDVLFADADTLAMKAQAESNMDLLVKSNALRDVAKSKNLIVEGIQKQLFELKRTL